MKITDFIRVLLLSFFMVQSLNAESGLKGPTEEDLQRLFDEAEKAEQENKPAEKVEKKKATPEKSKAVKKTTKPAVKPKPKRYKLTIKTIPTGATVRVTDIGPKYYAGIPLAVGTHTIKVSKVGYISQKIQVQVRNKNLVKTVKLKKKLVVSAPMNKQQEHNWIDRLLVDSPNVKPKNLPTTPSKNKTKRIGQYIDHGNGTITDTKTGLMWKKCSEGQYGNNCQGKARKYKWDDAMQLFKGRSFAVYNNWRMPTIKELHSLVYCSNGKSAAQARDSNCSLDGSSRDYSYPTINQRAFPNTPSFQFWSSSPVGNSAYNVRIVYFNYGSEFWDGKNYSTHVRLVRNGQ